MPQEKRVVELAFKSRMEEKAAKSHYEIADERNQKYGVMAVPLAAADAFDTEQQEETVGDRVHNFGSVDSRIVILDRKEMRQPTITQKFSAQKMERYTSSHQFNVEVTGVQYPTPAGGYGTKYCHIEYVERWVMSVLPQGGERTMNDRS